MTQTPLDDAWELPPKPKILDETLCMYITVTDWMLQRDPKQELMKAFQLFDDDQTGKISVRNLRRVARELGENMSEDELRAMIDEFDTDNDGESKLNV